MRTAMICMGLSGMLALAACGGPEKAESNAASGEKAESAGSGAPGVKMQPGEWETTVETVKVEAPNMPKEVIGMIGGQQKMTMRSCVTPEQAAEPSGDLFRGKKDGNCTYQNFSVSGGKVKGTMTCSGGDMPGSVSLEMDGQYGGDSYDVSQKMTTTGQGMSMKIETHVTGRRIGDCPAGAQG